MAMFNDNNSQQLVFTPLYVLVSSDSMINIININIESNSCLSAQC